MPLPAKGKGRLHYPALYRDRNEYETREWPNRRDLWRGLLAKHQPDLLICYGTGKRGAQWTRYADIVAVEPRPLRSGRSRMVRCGRTRVYLMPFLGQGQCSLDHLAEVIATDHECRRQP